MIEATDSKFDLKESLALLESTHPAAIEEVARRELGLIKPGEKVFIIKDLPPAKP